MGLLALKALKYALLYYLINLKMVTINEKIHLKNNNKKDLLDIRNCCY